MPDREKVIERLEYCAETRDGYVRDCINDVLALLKEQDFAKDNAVPDKIVRCKDCKWYSEKGFCKHPNGGAGNIRPDDWFCADGERR